MKVRSVILVLAVAALAVPLRADVPAPANEARPIEKQIEELKVIAELVKQLDDAKFEARQTASDRLVRIGQPAIDPLKLVLEGKPSLETSNRITSILKAIHKEKSGSDKLRKKLTEPITLDNGLGPNCTLNDALEFLSDRYDLTILVDEEAFQTIGVQKAGETSVILPKMVGVPLRLVLKKLLAQVKGDQYRGTFLARGDHIEVTTTYHANPLHWSQWRQAVPTIECAFDREPLQEALRQLSELTGISVVVDPRALDKVRKTVTAELNDVPLDTAVGLLADMADLRPVSLDNVLYITSRENAKVLEAEKAERAPKRDVPDKPVPNKEQ